MKNEKNMPYNRVSFNLKSFIENNNNVFRNAQFIIKI